MQGKRGTVFLGADEGRDTEDKKFIERLQKRGIIHNAHTFLNIFHSKLGFSCVLLTCFKS